MPLLDYWRSRWKININQNWLINASSLHYQLLSLLVIVPWAIPIWFTFAPVFLLFLFVSVPITTSFLNHRLLLGILRVFSGCHVNIWPLFLFPMDQNIVSYYKVRSANKASLLVYLYRGKFSWMLKVDDMSPALKRVKTIDLRV